MRCNVVCVLKLCSKTIYIYTARRREWALAIDIKDHHYYSKQRKQRPHYNELQHHLLAAMQKITARAKDVGLSKGFFFFFTENGAIMDDVPSRLESNIAETQREGMFDRRLILIVIEWDLTPPPLSALV